MVSFLQKIIKKIRAWWFERQLRKNYTPDTYVYAGDEIFEPEKESQETKNSS